MKEWHDLIGTSDGGSISRQSMDRKGNKRLGRSISETVATVQVTWLSLL